MGLRNMKAHEYFLEGLVTLFSKPWKKCYEALQQAGA